MRRSTDSVTGETTWLHSPLLSSAIRGDLCVLDGVEKLRSDVLRTLQSLATDRFVQLPNSQRLAGEGRAGICEGDGGDQGSDGVLKIHPSFRIIALATLPSAASSATGSVKFLNDETLAMFQAVHVPLPSLSDIEKILRGRFPNLPRSAIDRILVLHSDLTPERASDAGVGALTLRNIIRVAGKVDPAAPDSSLHSAVKSVLMSDLLPPNQQEILNEILLEAGIGGGNPVGQRGNAESDDLETLISDIKSARKSKTVNRELVPSPLFYDIPQHEKLMREILTDIRSKESAILLIGNQGVGKNKIADRILQLIEFEREYIQLHRDSTVTQLTISPTLIDGKIVWEDSPLVKAVTHGRVLMIDEADKAPLEVVSILKSLVEDKEMYLSDGRRIVSPEIASSSSSSSPDESIIPIHPDFRLIVLANRPGFPFLGNDFFREVGDCFSAHAVSNPDLKSEKLLLKSYAPKTSDAIIDKLASSFADLRKLSDSGDIAYPFSTREAVAIAKHIEQYPSDGLAAALSNVLHFDTFDEEIYKQLVGVFRSNGIPVVESARGGGAVAGIKINLAKAEPLPEPTEMAGLGVGEGNKDGDFIIENIDSMHLDSQVWKLPTPNAVPFHPTENRIEEFSHLVRSWSGKGARYSKSRGVAVMDGEGGDCPSIHVLSASPITISSFYGAIPNSPSPTKIVTELEDSVPHYYYEGAGQSHPVICALPKSSQLFVFVPSLNAFLTVDPLNGKTRYTNLPPSEGMGGGGGGGFSLFGGGGGGRRGSERRKKGLGWGICEDLLGLDGKILLYEKGGGNVCVVENVDEGGGGAITARWLSLGDKIEIEKITCSSEKDWWVHEGGGKAWNVRYKNEESFTGPSAARVEMVEADRKQLSGFSIVSAPAPPPHLKEDERCRGILSAGSSYVTSVGELGSSALFVTGRDEGDEATLECVCEYRENDKHFVSLRRNLRNNSQFIEVIDVEKHERRQIEVELGSEGEMVTELKRLTPDLIVGLTNGGRVLVYEIGSESIKVELGSFREMLGLPKEGVPDGEGVKALTLEYESLRDGSEGKSWVPPKLEGPKFGDWDDKNEAHVGGSNWAGGTGGSNTAGLGGRGGPYRLDRGHKVHQVSDESKAEVSEESMKLAREMAEKALQDKLREINMGEDEFEMYENLVSPIRSDISNLRNSLSSVEAKKVERGWLLRQSFGELDDSKLVDGAVGEKFVFKRRGVQGNAGGGFKNPKKIRFVMDCSGSMYRFNGTDGRLDRSLEAAALIMESFNGNEGRFDYSIVGHSGDSPCIELVKFGEHPKTESDRIKVLRAMVAHTQYCRTGDNTLEAIAMAKQDVVNCNEDADEYIVVAVSDANFRRYGISPSSLKNVVEGGVEKEGSFVKTYAIFIATSGDEAGVVKDCLRKGRAFVCGDTKELPRIIREVLKSSGVGKD